VKLLYVATDQQVPGSTGGSVHVVEVANGLASRGHEVHVVAQPGEKTSGSSSNRFQLHPSQTLVPHRMFRWTAEKQIGTLIDRLGVDAVLERYYNFGGEGVRAAYRRGVPVLLEVNAPVIDHPGSLKAWLDRLLFFRPMQRLREEQCRKAAALVTPLPAILPPTVPSDKVHPIHWGANVEHFRPGLLPSGLAAELPIPPHVRVVVFSGSFRRWHGADVLVKAAARLITKRKERDLLFLFLGSGPGLVEVRREVNRCGIGAYVHLTGAVPYHQMPLHLARCHIGVAPYQPSRHGQLQLGFYWSPLKIFEYMACGLPVVTLDVHPLREIVRPGQEGLLVQEGDENSLADAIAELVASPERAAEMGRSARERVVSHYSWQVHCEKLEKVLQGLVKAESA
jgi:glycosyltransferase involved in cell wall biosynthesis